MDEMDVLPMSELPPWRGDDRLMPPEIAAAIIKIEGQIERLGNDEKNAHAQYSYVSIDKFYEVVGPLMAEAGLALLINETSSDIRAGDSGKGWLFVQYELVFMHVSGVTAPPLRRSCALPISGPQAYGAAQSYIEKQFLRQMFKIPTGDRDADDTAQNEDAPARRSEGRGAQGSRYPSRSTGALEKASTEALRAKRDANALRTTLLGSIENADKTYVLNELPESPWWGECRAAYVRAAIAEGSAEADATRRAGLVMDGLAKAIEMKKRELLGAMG
jgi:hypothetical protein